MIEAGPRGPRRSFVDEGVEVVVAGDAPLGPDARQVVAAAVLRARAVGARGADPWDLVAELVLAPGLASLWSAVDATSLLRAAAAPRARAAFDVELAIARAVARANRRGALVAGASDLLHAMMSDDVVAPALDAAGLSAASIDAFDGDA